MCSVPQCVCICNPGYYIPCCNLSRSNAHGLLFLFSRISNILKNYAFFIDDRQIMNAKNIRHIWQNFISSLFFVFNSACYLTLRWFEFSRAFFLPAYPILASGELDYWRLFSQKLQDWAFFRTIWRLLASSYSDPFEGQKNFGQSWC